MPGGLMVLYASSSRVSVVGCSAAMRDFLTRAARAFSEDHRDVDVAFLPHDVHPDLAAVALELDVHHRVAGREPADAQAIDERRQHGMQEADARLVGPE